MVANALKSLSVENLLALRLPVMGRNVIVHSETVDCVQDFLSLVKRHLNGVHYKKTINVGGKMFKSCILFIASVYFVCSESTSCFAAKKLLSFTK